MKTSGRLSRGLCKSQFFFDLREGVLTGSTRLAQREGPGIPHGNEQEASKRYPNIPFADTEMRSSEGDGVLESDTELFDGWPQWNDDQEAVLRKDLLALAGADVPEARARIRKLEEDQPKAGPCLGGIKEAPWHAPWSTWPSWRNLREGGLRRVPSAILKRGTQASAGRWTTVRSGLGGNRSRADLEAVKSAVRSV